MKCKLRRPGRRTPPLGRPRPSNHPEWAGCGPEARILGRKIAAYTWAGEPLNRYLLGNKEAEPNSNNSPHQQ